jgi:hypothetical protein
MLTRSLLTIAKYVCCAVLFGTAFAGQEVSKLDGYGGYKFGMTFQEALAVRRDVRITNCEYAGVEKCLERDATIFGEKANIIVQINKAAKRVNQIVIKFDRIDVPPGSQSCIKTLESIRRQIIKIYNPAEAKRDGVQTIWYFPRGGRVVLNNICMTEDRGMIVVTYAETEGL